MPEPRAGPRDEPSAEPSAFLAAGLARAAQTAAALSQPDLAAGLSRVAVLLEERLRAGGRLFFLGNGGSAADAGHLAAEFVGRCSRDRDPLPALALSDASATLTALGNDYGYEEVFARQVRAWVGPTDVVIGLSTSGRSSNVLAALRAARLRGAATVGLTGADAGGLPEVCDLLLVAPSDETPRIQEAHQVWGHLLAEWVERSVLP